MPASSQASPTSGMRVTSSPHLSQAMTTSSIHGRCSSRRPSSPRTARSLELGARPDHGQVAARARVEGQRQAEVPLARDVPVAHVPQPVVHPLRVEGGRPFDGCVRVEQRLPDLVGRDEPVVDDPEEERRLAAPADGIAVDDPPGLDEQTRAREGPRRQGSSTSSVENPSSAPSCRTPVARTRRSGRSPGGRAPAKARSLRSLRPARCGRSPSLVRETSSQGMTRWVTSAAPASRRTGLRTGAPTSSSPLATRVCRSPVTTSLQPPSRSARTPRPA